MMQRFADCMRQMNIRSLNDDPVRILVNPHDAVFGMLSEGTSSYRINAEFKDGMLKLHLSKDEKAKPKTVEVKLAILASRDG